MKAQFNLGLLWSTFWIMECKRNTQSAVLRLSLKPNCESLNICSDSHHLLILFLSAKENILAITLTSVIPL